MEINFLRESARNPAHTDEPIGIKIIGWVQELSLHPAYRRRWKIFLFVSNDKLGLVRRFS
jgi:hypothetical protein